jgi:subtilisin family serine protease
MGAILSGCHVVESGTVDENGSNSIAFVQDNTTLPPSSQEPYFYQQWYIDKSADLSTREYIDQDAGIHTHNLLDTYSGKGVKIAIIDDGVDVNHEDLRGAFIALYDSSTKTTDVYNADDGHGTSVAGIIAARSNGVGIRGIASRAEVIFLKYKELMSDAETIELFNKAEEFGADIINCSWGTYDVSDAVKAKIVDLANNGRNGKGTLIVFAVGNDDIDLDAENDESSIEEVIAVGATDEENLRARYSNYGSSLDVMAPGGYYVGLTTTDNRGYSGYADGDYVFYNSSKSFIGTSAAAPVVSGVLAILLEKYPDLTREEVFALLKRTSDKVGTENIEYNADGFNQYYGYGKINLSALLQ